MDRRFTSEQVSRVLERAAEVEDGSRPSELAQPLYSLAELEEIAQESGISQDALHRAMQEVARPPPTAMSRLLGAPVRFGAEVRLSRQLGDADIELVVRTIRRSLDQVGELSRLGNTITWVARQGSVPVSVSIENDPANVTISLKSSFEGLIGGLYGGIGGGVGGGASALWVLLAQSFMGPGPASIFVGLGASLATGFALARFFYTRAVNKHTKRLEALALELPRMASPTSVPPS